mmetsp:Transcript_40113/g.103823  ORF Transcript_40113/g.103823 Transcript_40113/m.103823 type:complete len:285 (-) Transcript_40113:213-1067(-)
MAITKALGQPARALPRGAERSRPPPVSTACGGAADSVVPTRRGLAPGARRSNRGRLLVRGGGEGGQDAGAAARVADTEVDDGLLRVEIPTSDVRQSIRVGGIAVGRGRGVAITVVAPESEAYQAGLREGCRLVAISDPARAGEMWVLNERVSLRFVRDSLRMRIAPTITLVVEPPSEEWAAAAAEQAKARREAAAASEQSEEGAAGTVAEELEAAARRQARDKSAVERRIQARKDYLGEVSERDDSKFFALIAAAFFLPAIVILLVAFGSGYMDELQMNNLRGL